MRTLCNIARILIGAVFFVAGLFKLMDPVGAGLAVGDYLRFFHLGFLSPAALWIAEFFAFLEAVVGAGLMTGVWKKQAAAVSAAMLVFFTILTTILLIANPNIDCGCFGEVIHLSHEETFWKNIVLDGLWCLAFLPKRGRGEVDKKKYVGFWIAAASMSVFAFLSLISIPLVDYTPFKPGVELDEVSTELSENLSFFDADGEYCDSLAVDGSVVVVSVYKPERARWEDIAEFGNRVNGARLLVLVSGDPDEIAAAAQGTCLEGKVYFADRRKLMTFNRSNGGVTYLSDGQIVRKWPALLRPEAGDLASLYGGNPIEQSIKENSANRLYLQGFLLYTFAVMLLL